MKPRPLAAAVRAWSRISSLVRRRLGTACAISTDFRALPASRSRNLRVLAEVSEVWLQNAAVDIAADLGNERDRKAASRIVRDSLHSDRVGTIPNALGWRYAF